ncbi:MAG: Rrf2 family transcriptional regulator [Acetivibrionales bacterium]|nr:Rrf2 family transcriptional regulator [Bacillota bacterium]NLP07472.1 Rrf2 family transcriptional regulator [Clostridiaceae bacterium]HOA55724.1 Rrf2 family transcriptional regulator [Clostridiales bacterium]HPZ04948.1 Rrf2 family transcriptional regulator [Clostridiales bacterium]HQD31845.1 Rrf2 family transcriptional regulator [Clostridiales bacterium]
MKLSTKGRYGLKAILDLALHSADGQITLNSIAERQGLSESYLEQLFAALKKAELIKSIRGPQGGYMLADDPENISVGDILRALEGSMAPTDCVAENGHHDLCDSSDRCITRGVWEKIRDGINNVIDNISLQELIDDYYRNNKKRAPDNA